MTRVRDVMTSGVRRVTTSSSALDAARLMRDQTLGFLPVCDPSSGRLVAVITDRDLVTRLMAEERPAAATQVGEVATAHPVVCPENADLRVAEEAMRRHQVSRLVIVDADDHPIGVLSLTDLVVRDKGRRALQTARGVLARESHGPHQSPDTVSLTPGPLPDAADDDRPVPPTAREIYDDSRTVQEREGYVIGGSETRGVKEFPR